MGTNFYATKPTGHKDKVFCEHCGNEGTDNSVLHIGKASFGWRFLFERQGDRLRTVQSWIDYLVDPTVKITTEYGEVLTAEDFLNKEVLSRQGQKSHEEYRGTREGIADIADGPFS